MPEIEKSLPGYAENIIESAGLCQKLKKACKTMPGA